MVQHPSLSVLAQWLAGEFHNQPQAQADPVWFVPLRLWHRPLPQLLEGHFALFAEQANTLQLDRPYRQRVLVLRELDTNPSGNPLDIGLEIQYFAFKNPQDFRGCGANSERLQSLTLADLDLLPGCVLEVTWRSAAFEAALKPGCRCCFEYQGQIRQVVLGFKVTETSFWSYDRGVDPDTGRGLWGALMGPYVFQKQLGMD